MALDVSMLTRTIDREVAVLRAFTDVLHSEQAALIYGDTDQLAAFVQPKSQHMLDLTRHGDERGRWLAGLGLTTNRAGMERLLQAYPAATALQTSWRQLLQLTETAQQLNTTNGMLIDARLGSTQRALNAIFSTARMPGAYGADGGTVSLRTAQQLAVA